MKRCLIVDDSDVIRKVARVILERMDFDVIEANDGPNGIELCQARGPHVVLVDWEMPGMNGLAFLQALRAASHDQMPLIVYCTTENDPVDIGRARQAGADAVLMKPFDRASIMAAMAEIGLS
ncbi:MAG: response regulator [Bacteroidota bacterium]|jgi:two-component system chemotaxis response regulator CheY